MELQSIFQMAEEAKALAKADPTAQNLLRASSLQWQAAAVSGADRDRKEAVDLGFQASKATGQEWQRLFGAWVPFLSAFDLMAAHRQFMDVLDSALEPSHLRH